VRWRVVTRALRSAPKKGRLCGGRGGAGGDSAAAGVACAVLTAQDARRWCDPASEQRCMGRGPSYGKLK
jgi:hypothetical protein